MPLSEISPLQRHFLGWDRPTIPLAAAWMMGRYANGNHLDLRNVLITLPTLRGVRQLERRLDELADAGGVTVQRGWVGTVGSLPERLYKLDDVFGRPTRWLQDLEQTLTWSEVLAAADAEALRRLVARVPAADDQAGWMSLAGTIQRLYIDLSAAGVSMTQIADALELPGEQIRWRTLVDLLERYQQHLDTHHATDEHLARRRALATGRCDVGGEVVMVGCTDLSPTIVEMLSQRRTPVQILVAAPENESSAFDSAGNVDRRYWSEATIAIDDAHWIAAGDTSDAAEVAVSLVEQIAREEDLTADQITVGVTDASQVPALEFALAGRDIASFRNLGYSIAQTAVGRLLRLVRDYISRRGWDTIAALLRHPDALTAIGGNDDALAKLDAYRAEHYPVHVDDAVPPMANSNHAAALAFPTEIDAWLAPLRKPEQTLSQRSAAAADWLRRVYPLDNDKHSMHPRTASAAVSMIDWLDKHARIAAAVDPVIAPEAMLNIAIDATETLKIADDPAEGDTHLLGWLDLALDDSPALVVVGLNHPYVPEAVTADAFLPGSVRSRFRIADNERRFARDAHYLKCITSSRSAVRLIVGKTSADGSPTPPSRLISLADSDRVARRIRRLFTDHDSLPPLPHRWDQRDDQQRLTPPDLNRLPAPNIDRMSVTSFKSYLTCPYRFYLRHVLHLKPIDDTGGELAANQFGDLVHNSLEWWGQSAAVHETRPQAIELAMHTALDRYAKEIYGSATTAAVQLQIHRAKQKLAVVARIQAERIAAGWVVDRVEAAVNQDVAGITIDGHRMGLRGRFDRIDHHPASGRWAILDYKTHGFAPEKKHLEKRDGVEHWVDLQLPLYRRMVPFLNIDADPADVEVGYFNIADRDADTKINLATFTPAQWRSADERIDEIVRQIFAGNFEPSDEPPKYDDYAMILQTEVISDDNA